MMSADTKRRLVSSTSHAGFLHHELATALIGQEQCSVGRKGAYHGRSKTRVKSSETCGGKKGRESKTHFPTEVFQLGNKKHVDTPGVEYLKERFSSIV